MEPPPLSRPMLAPEAPEKGMRFWLQDRSWGPRKSFVGAELVVSRRSVRYFHVATTPRGMRGVIHRRERHPIAHWPDWLRGLDRRGQVFFNEHPMLLSSSSEARFQVDVQARDLRMGRATRDVLPEYRIEPVKVREDEMVFQVEKPAGEAYTVSVWRTWSAPPTCTCPDAARVQVPGKPAAWCKHVLAVLMSRDELRGQLLDLYL